MPQRPKIAANMLELIGYTPLVRLNRIAYPGSAEIIVKLESQNPMDSVKDRIGAAMILAAERDGKIRPGETVIIEPTSGNTGIALAFAATVKGYKLIVTMPDTVTEERRRVLVALGAEVILTPGADGMKGAIKRASDLAEETPDSWTPGQFDNPANPEVHRLWHLRDAMVPGRRWQARVLRGQRAGRGRERDRVRGGVEQLPHPEVRADAVASCWRPSPTSSSGNSRRPYQVTLKAPTTPSALAPTCTCRIRELRSG